MAPVEQFEKLLEKGFFLSMEENQSVVAAVREIISNRKDIEVYTLSATLAENPYAIEEKDAWLTTHIPELDTSHRLYSRCGSGKSQKSCPVGIEQAMSCSTTTRIIFSIGASAAAV